jgi:hypothetical protein
MTPEKILLACEKYKDLLLAYKPIRYSTAERILALERDCRDYNREKSLNHALWMCTVIEEQVKDGKAEKAERWLCFIQGVLWMNGICSIDEMRDDNRE